MGRNRNERRLSSLLNQSLNVAIEASNQMVGSSNLSGRAILAKKANHLAVVGYFADELLR